MAKWKLSVLGMVLVLGAAACGDSAEERLVEELIERGGSDISDIDINTDDGGFNLTIEGEDGEDINVVGEGEDGEFSMTVEGEDGQTITIGGGEVPDGLKTPVPDGGSVLQTFSDQTNRSVVIQYPTSSFDELVSLYDGLLGSEDMSRNESSFSTEEGTIRSVNWYSDDGQTNVSVGDCYSTSGELDSVCVNILESDG